MMLIYRTILSLMHMLIRSESEDNRSIQHRSKELYGVRSRTHVPLFQAKSIRRTQFVAYTFFFKKKCDNF
jgi:hypothetical protein